MTQQDILNRLREGNKRFAQDRLNNSLRDSTHRKNSIEEQTPFATVLTCADSRVTPEILFDAGLGELFVVRVAGNIANRSSIGSVEFASAYVGVQVIVVVGHQSCGAIESAVAGGNYGDNLDYVLEHIRPVLEMRKESDRMIDIIKNNARHTARQLLKQSPTLQALHKKNELIIVPAYYDMESGLVQFMDLG